MNSPSQLTARWWLGCLCSSICCAAVAQSGSPLNFAAYLGPATVNRDATISFGMVATNNGAAFDYELIAAPTNAVFWKDNNVGRPYYWMYTALFGWQAPSRSYVGTTNFFVVRAFELTNPAVAVTGVVSIIVVDLPPIHSFEISNGVPILQLTDLLSDRGYLVEWAAALPCTNWSPLYWLSRFEGRPPVVTVPDPQPLQEQRFYRLSPVTDYYVSPGPP
jgi:hypothetical protein